MTAARRVLVVHPSAELYGSDRQLLESVRALTAAGCRVQVCVPVDGPLLPLLRASGAEVLVVPVPVLRRSALRPAGLAGLAAGAVRALPAVRAVLRRTDPQLVLVNTLTVPVWLLGSRSAGLPTVVHVHEAEQALPRLLAVGLHAQALLAGRVLVNSRAAAAALTAALPGLGERLRLLHNGVPGPRTAPPPAAPTAPDPARLVLVGRLSARKGSDVAVAAVALLRRRGIDVRLTLVGDVFPGYEWFREELVAQVRAEGLQDHVELAGFRPDVWPALAAADVVLVPSRAEPFGNVAVEAALAGRPRVVSAVQGLVEIVTDGRDGLLVPPGDPAALADAVQALLSDWPRARALARAASADARARFAPEAYGRRLLALLEEAGLPAAEPSLAPAVA